MISSANPCLSCSFVVFMVIRFTKSNAAVASECPVYEYTRTLFNNEPREGIQIDIACDAYRRFQGYFSKSQSFLLHIASFLLKNNTLPSSRTWISTTMLITSTGWERIISRFNNRASTDVKAPYKSYDCLSYHYLICLTGEGYKIRSVDVWLIS